MARGIWLASLLAAFAFGLGAITYYLIQQFGVVGVPLLGPTLVFVILTGSALNRVTRKIEGRRMTRVGAFANISRVGLMNLIKLQKPEVKYITVTREDGSSGQVHVDRLYRLLLHDSGNINKFVQERWLGRIDRSLLDDIRFILKESGAVRVRDNGALETLDLPTITFNKVLKYYNIN